MHARDEDQAARDPRARMAAIGRGLPRPIRAALQAYFTWLTGKPAPGLATRARLGPGADTLRTLGVLAAGTGLSAWALGAGPRAWALVVPGWILATGSLRKLLIVVQHGCVHGNLEGGRARNAAAADALAIVALLPSHARFREEHVVRHHGASFGGPDDPDAALLLGLGLGPGVPRARLWRRFLLTLLSPRFHLRFLGARLADPFVRAPPARRLAAWAAWTALLLGVHAGGAWPEFTLAWLVPALPGFHAAALASIVGEHLWFTPRAPDESMARYQRRLTSARFAGSAPPGALDPAPLRALRWLAWWLAHLTYWPAVRIALLPGDLPAHDFHHAHPNVPWTEALDERQRALERGEPLSEVWGAFAAIDRTFANLARLPGPGGQAG